MQQIKCCKCNTVLEYKKAEFQPFTIQLIIPSNLDQKDSFGILIL